MKFWWIAILLVIADRNDGYNKRQARKTKQLTEKEAMLMMMQGKGGTTIIETGMTDHLIVKSGTYHTCTSMTIHGNTINCKSKFKELAIDDMDKYCFAQRYSVWQNTKSTKYCIASDGEATSFGYGERNRHRNVLNDADIDDDDKDKSLVECIPSTSVNAPTLFIDDTEYVKMCKIKPDQERLFVFYANTKRDIPHIQRTAAVRCEGVICRFKAKLKLDKSVASTFRLK